MDILNDSIVSTTIEGMISMIHFLFYLTVIVLQLDEADKDQIMSEDILWFMEKAYYDAANCIDDKYWFSLASLYYYDRYGHVDFAKAVEYLEKAVETGDGRAEVLLGKCYLNGEGVPQDYEKAFHLLEKGALLDFSGEAIYLLGDMYLNGWYVKQDKPQAYQMYLRTMNILDYRDLTCADVYLRLAAYELNEIPKRSSIKKALRYHQESESTMNSWYSISVERRRALLWQEKARTQREHYWKKFARIRTRLSSRKKISEIIPPVE